MRQTDFARFHCSLSRALDAAGDWWSPLILRDVFVGLRRFDELVRDLGLSRNILAARLEQLVDRGLVEPQTYGPHPKRFEYWLTPSGAELVVVFMAMTAWGDKFTPPTGGPAITFSHRGHHCEPAVVCRHCQSTIQLDDIEGHVGPGGRIAKGTRLMHTKLKPAQALPAHPLATSTSTTRGRI